MSLELQRAMIPVEEIMEVFVDLTPIPQDDGPERVCVIQYPTSFTLAYNYLRAVWAADELSERALRLSATCLKLNPANYTVWHFRRQCLNSLGLLSDKEAIQKDLNLAGTLGGSNPKNYQIWYHRRALLESYGARDFCDSELEYISAVLREDSKNYHAWSYRQWIIQSVDEEDLWQKEIEYASRLIEDDIRNNSAWNERWFAVHRGKRGNALSIDTTRMEAQFAIEKGAADPYNESPWRYLIGILKEQHQSGNDAATGLIIEYEAKAYDARSVLIDADRDPDGCSNLTSVRIDLLEMVGDKESLQKASTLATGLANEYDLIRKKYWRLRADQLQQRLCVLSA